MNGWLLQKFQGLEMYCHDPGVVALNPIWVEITVHNTSVEVILEPNISSDFQGSFVRILNHFRNND